MARWQPVNTLLVLLAGLGCGAGLDLPAAMARADARTYAACGRRAAPVSVELVRGYIDCGPDARRAIGCANLTYHTITLSRVLRTQAQLDIATVHEYLHLLGAKHVPAGQGIMGVDRGSMIDRVTAADLAQADCPRRTPER